MRLALMLSGEPRFCREFDLLLNSIGSEHSVDWYCVFWSQSQRGASWGYDLVSERWLNIDESWARGKISENLPHNHRLAGFQLVNPDSVTAPQVSWVSGETSIDRMWRMFVTTKICNQMITDNYDLVIRARPDIGLSRPMNWTALARRTADKTLITPTGRVYGYSSYKINDMLAVARPQTMQVYSQCVDYIADYCGQGLIYHPETQLAHHCQAQGLNNIFWDFGHISFRELGLWRDKIYYSDFGRWA